MSNSFSANKWRRVGKNLTRPSSFDSSEGYINRVIEPGLEPCFLINPGFLSSVPQSERNSQYQPLVG